MNAGHKFLGPVKYNLGNFIYIDPTGNSPVSRQGRVVEIANRLLLNWIGFGIHIDNHLVLMNEGCVSP